MKYLETYGEHIGKGSDYIVSYIDDNWVLKTPDKEGRFGSTENRLKYFDFHIKFMQNYPQIFPKIKRLDKYRASVEKLDTETALKENEHIYNLMIQISPYKHTELSKRVDLPFMVDDIYNKQELLSKLGTYDDPITKKWYNFLTLVKQTLKNADWLDKYYPDLADELEDNGINYKELDMHSKNIGIDKNGNLKLLDF